MLARFTTRPAIGTATLIAAAILTLGAISALGSAPAGSAHHGHLPGYPYTTLSSVSR